MSDRNEMSMEDVVERFQRSLQEPVEWSTPSQETWGAIASALNLSDAEPTSTSPTDGAAPTAPPAADAPLSGATRRGLFMGLGGLVLGTALGAGGLRLAQSATEPRGIPVKRATLTPLEKEDEQLGVAELRPLDVGYNLVVDVPKGAQHAGGYVEVWLINVDGARMVSVGVFAAGTAAKFFVSDALIEAGYLIVDLSNEEFDDEP
ncbi:MAG: anti-sigma factor, partial [Propionibacteriaceae bacterium]|nr:anti-sigma factor [Propionibacteriaceae bacterium]